MHEIVQQALKEKKHSLTVFESKQLLKDYSLPINMSFFASSVQEIELYSQQLDFPLVMKIVSPQILHKSDVGGVILDLNSVEDTLTAYKQMIASIKENVPQAEIKGVILEEQIEKGLEFIAGTIIDPQFGLCLMFGLGGIFVELVKDVSFRLIPATKDEINSMFDELKFSEIFQGIRGYPRVNLENLTEVLVKLASFAENYKNEISEIDLNPIIVNGDKITIPDARILF